MAAPASPVRRPLADKTTNASIKDRKHDDKKKMTQLKAYSFTPLRNDSAGFDKTDDPKIGHKRSIDLVDGAQEREQADSKHEACEPMRETKVKIGGLVKENGDYAMKSESDHETAPKQAGDDAETEPKSEDSKATTSTLLTSFHASQEGPLPIEEQFAIQDEVSQDTLETLVSGNA